MLSSHHHKMQPPRMHYSWPFFVFSGKSVGKDPLESSKRILFWMDKVVYYFLHSTILWLFIKNIFRVFTLKYVKVIISITIRGPKLFKIKNFMYLNDTNHKYQELLICTSFYNFYRVTVHIISHLAFPPFPRLVL